MEWITVARAHTNNGAREIVTDGQSFYVRNVYSDGAKIVRSCTYGNGSLLDAIRHISDGFDVEIIFHKNI